MSTTEEHLQSPSKHMQARTQTSIVSLARCASLRHSSSALHHRVKFVKSLLVSRKTQTDLRFDQKRKGKKACSAAKNRRLSLADLFFWFTWTLAIHHQPPPLLLLQLLLLPRTWANAVNHCPSSDAKTPRSFIDVSHSKF